MHVYKFHLSAKSGIVQEPRIKLTSLVEVREKSSHYGLNMLGYTCATKAKTVGRDGEIQSKSPKIVLVRIVDWNSFT